MTRKLVQALAVATNLMLAACFPSLELPDGAALSCADDTHCPKDMFCNPNTQLCVPSSRQDLSAPSLLTSELTPQIVGQSEEGYVTALLTLVVDKPLAGASRVTFNDGKPRELSTLTLITSAEGQLTYEATYTPDGSETQTSHQLRALLEDEQGNRVETPLPLTIAFDFIAPSLATEPAPAVVVLPDPLNPLAHFVLTESQVATRTSQVVLSFATTEPVVEPTIYTIPSSSLQFSLVAAAGTRFTFEVDWEASAGDFDAIYGVSVLLEDFAGNTQEHTLPEVAVALDTRAPPTPAVDVPDAVQLIRAPWGFAGATDYSQVFVEGGDGAVEPFAWLLISRDALGQQEVGRVRADDNGGFGALNGTSLFELASGDLPTVFLRAIDAAGNSSDIVEVRDVVWAASLGGKMAGDFFSNPHRFDAARVRSIPLDTGGWRELDGAKLALRDDDVETTLGAGYWQAVPPGGSVSRAVFPAMGYDPHSGESVVFGSWRASISAYTTCGEPSDLLLSRRSAERWLEAATANKPPADGGASMVYDAARGEMLLYGGGGTSHKLWRRTATGWENLCTEEPCVSTRPTPVHQRYEMVYDPVRRVVYLLNEFAIYAWNGEHYTQLCVADNPCEGTFPTSDSLMNGWAITFDENLAEVLLFGAGASRDETWSFDGSRWSQLCTEEPCLSTRPPKRTHARLAFDRQRGESVLFAGNVVQSSDEGIFPCSDQYIKYNQPQSGVPPTPPYNDTWIFNGLSWLELTPSASPSPRYGHGMIYDESRGKVVMLGGTACHCSDSQDLMRDTWEWDGTTWKNVASENLPSGFSAIGPAGASQHAMFTEPVSGRPMMNGGGLNALFTWHAGRWLRADASSINNRSGAMVASALPAHQAGTGTAAPVALYGGIDGGLHEPPAPEIRVLSGAIWDLLLCNESSPSPFSCGEQNQLLFQAGASNGSHIITFGGSAPFHIEQETTTIYGKVSQDPSDITLNNNTHRFEQSTGWTLLCDSSPCSDERPSARARHAMSETGSSDEILLFGGAGTNGVVLADTWIYSGEQWSQNVSESQPEARAGHILVYDPSRESVVLTSGSNVMGYVGMASSEHQQHTIPQTHSEVWEWVEGEWHRASTGDPDGAGKPSPRYGAAAAYSVADAAIILYGGTPSPVLHLAGYSTSPENGLADTWFWRGGSGDRPAQRLTVSLAPIGSPLAGRINRLEIFWSATARGLLHGAETSEVVLAMWDGAGWRRLPVGECGPSCLHYDSQQDLAITSGAALERYLNQNRLLIVAYPAGSNGPAPGYAHIVTDHVEVRVSYKR